VSIQVPTATAGLPVVNQALEPEWVRHGSASTQKAYETALSFEETLVEQLSKSLTATSGLGGESSQEGESASEEGGSSATGTGGGGLSSMLPQALSASVMNAGGLGLAAQMTRGLGGVTETSHTQATGGTAPSATAGAGAGAGTPAAAVTGATGGTGAGTTAGALS
jgi:Rod binding domain-containing protein